jgi:putative peptidoglycan lipid II flippase
MLAEGALNAALVPGYLRARETEGAAAAAAFAGRVMGTLTLILVAIGTVLALAMPLVVALLAPGFRGQPTLALAVTDARLMLPYFAFVAPVSVMMGVLNAEHRYTLSAFSPVLFNIVLIGTMTGLLIWPHDPAFASHVIAGTVGVAGCLQTLVLIQRRPHRDGLATPLRIAFDIEMRGFLRKAIPGMIANSGPQLLIVAGAIIASSSPAAVSWLYFANRLIELPVGVVGVAMGTVLVPTLTRAVHDRDQVVLAQTESRGLELAIGLALPATLGLIALGEMIVRVLFEHGAFTAEDTRSTATALAMLALGLPAHVLVKTLAPAFFARDNTMTPLIAALAGVVVAVIAGMALGSRFGANGVAASIALASWFSAALLLRTGAATFGFSFDAVARRRLPRIVISAAAMGAGLAAANAFVAPVTAQADLIAQLIILGSMIAGGISFYALLLELLGVVSWTKAIGDLRG